MSVRLIKVAVFDHPVRARVARNYLEAEGIPAFLGNDQIAEMNWGITNAIGGIELKVEESQAEKARVLLERIEDTGAEALAMVELTDDVDSANEAEVSDVSPPQGLTEAEIDEVPTEREENARRAAISAVFGLGFWPLQFYVSWLLLEIFASEERLNAKSKRQAVTAAVINIPFMLVIVIGLLLVAGSAVRAALQS